MATIYGQNDELIKINAEKCSTAEGLQSFNM